MSFPYYKQHDAMQCGITCLQMICKHYGKEFSTETLSSYCFATTEGVSLLGISEATNKLGLYCICGRVSMEQMREAPLPCILHWKRNAVFHPLWYQHHCRGISCCGFTEYFLNFFNSASLALLRYFRRFAKQS